MKPTIVVLLAVFPLSACETRAGHIAGERDSAGIAIVDNTSPRGFEGGHRWSIDTAPQLTIGDDSAVDPGYVLDDVVGARHLSNGHILIASAPTTLLDFDSTGHLARSLGRAGDGPGEFRSIERVLRADRDPLVVDAVGRIVRLSENAGYIATIPVAGYQIMAAFDAGNYVAAEGGGMLFSIPMNAGKPGPQIQRRGYDRVTSVGKATSFGELPVGMLDGATNAPYALGPSATGAANDDGYFHGLGDTYEVVMRDTSGAVRRIVRRTWSPVAVTDDDRAQFARSFMTDQVTGKPYVGPTLELMRRRVAEKVFATNLPAFVDMQLDPRGYLWVENARAADRLEVAAPFLIGAAPVWSVFSKGGEWLGDVIFPRVKVLDIADECIVGLYTDVDGAQSVRQYRLRRQ